MSSTPRMLEMLRNEQGQMTVMVALVIPTLIAFIAIVVVVGGWLEHRQHLQTQVDAAALAGAQDYAFPCTSTVNQKIVNTVQQYGLTLNPQVDAAKSTGGVHILPDASTGFANSATYFNQSKSDDAPTGTPCTTGVLDVKATDTDVAGIFGVQVAPFINAHARVELFTAGALKPDLPIAVQSSVPNSVRAFFVDESDGSTIASATLARNGTDANGNAAWDNVSAPVAVNVANRSKIGVRIALGGGASTVCGTNGVVCLEQGTSNGLAFIQGWTAAGTVNPATDEPLVRSVSLASTSCPDPYFSSITTACSVSVHANVDFGTGANNPTLPTNQGGVRALLKATGNGQTVDLTYQAGTGEWTSPETIPVSPGAGPIPITLSWEKQDRKVGNKTCSVNNNDPKCKGDFGTVQRTYSAGASSGAVKLLQVLKGGVQGANTLQQCSASPAYTTCSESLAVRVSIGSNLQAATSSSEKGTCLYGCNAGNQTGALDCDPSGGSYKDQFQNSPACPKYNVNTSGTCPSSVDGFPTCVPIEPGDQSNQIASGLNFHILGDEKATVCNHPNLYVTNFGTNYTDDPRLVQLVVTDFGTLSGGGSGSQARVVQFAAFYITGWGGSGAGFINPCSATDEQPPAGHDSNFVIGHFITNVKPDADPTSTRCNPTALNTCVPKLTR